MITGKDFVGIGCGAIVIKDDEVLLVRRPADARTEPSTWSRPGGALEFGETLMQCAERETYEETGIICKAEEFLEYNENQSSGQHWIGVGFLAKYVSGEAVNKEPEKHDDVRWFKLADLPSNLNSYTAKALEIVMDKL